MRLTSVWVAHGLLDERTEVAAHLVADTFEEAARLAPLALQYGWGSRQPPPVQVTALSVAHLEVRLDG